MIALDGPFAIASAINDNVAGVKCLELEVFVPQSASNITALFLHNPTHSRATGGGVWASQMKLLVRALFSAVYCKQLSFFLTMNKLIIIFVISIFERNISLETHVGST